MGKGHKTCPFPGDNNVVVEEYTIMSFLFNYLVLCTYLVHEIAKINF
jgi:hypothetical protein